MEKIGDITKRVISNWIFEDEERNFDIEVVWNRIIDENLKGHTYVNGLKNKVDSSCYLSILNMKRKEIIKKLENKGFKIKKMILKL